MPTSPSSTRRRARIATLTALALALVLSFAACGSSSGGGGGGSSAAVTIKNLAFKTSAVKAGATVTVKNDDTVQHTVTADDGPSFDVTVDPGKTKTFTAPDKAGTFKFHCNIHSTMHGTLTVE